MKKIYMIACNPKANSLKTDYVNAYKEEAEKAGNEVRTINIYDLEISYLGFNANEPILYLTEELKRAQDNILWADQVVLVYPVWALGVPAKLKSFIERVFEPNVLFDYGKMGPQPRLKDKTAVIMHSYDMPHFALKFMYGDVISKMWKVLLTNWCGFKIEKTFELDMISTLSEEKKQKRIERIRKFASKIN